MINQSNIAAGSVPTPGASPTPMETLLGGGDLVVKLADGATETVRIRQVPVRLADRYMACVSDEAGMVELLTGKPAAWVDNLTRESHEAIIAEGDRINSDFFERVLRRRLAWMERLAPGSVGNLLASPPLTPSPKPPSDAA